MVISVRMQRLAEIGLEANGVGGLPCLFTECDGWLKTQEKCGRIASTFERRRPELSKLWVQTHCFSKIFLGGNVIGR